MSDSKEMVPSEEEFLQEEMLPEQSQNKSGITILVDILNGGQFDILYDFNNPDEATCKAFALFLTLAETGNLYTAFKNKIQEVIKEKDPDKTQILKTVFKFKAEMDLNIDQPAILPRDVFRRGG